jgi:hypothetical protein
VNKPRPRLPQRAQRHKEETYHKFEARNPKLETNPNDQKHKISNKLGATKGE